MTEFDGIGGTAIHPIYINNQWIDLGNVPGARHLSGDGVASVYNLITENNIIPVIGSSGNLYLMGDDLHNYGDVSERGRLKLSMLSAKLQAA